VKEAESEDPPHRPFLLIFPHGGDDALRVAAIGETKHDQVAGDTELEHVATF
jgi:hypothetical protein